VIGAWLKRNGATLMICLILVAIPVGLGIWHSGQSSAPTDTKSVGTVANPQNSRIVADPTNRSANELLAAIQGTNNAKITVTRSLQAYPRWYVVTVVLADNGALAKVLLYDDPDKGLVVKAGVGTSFDYATLTAKGVPAAAVEALNE